MTKVTGAMEAAWVGFDPGVPMPDTLSPAQVAWIRLAFFHGWIAATKHARNHICHKPGCRVFRGDNPPLACDCGADEIVSVFSE